MQYAVFNLEARPPPFNNYSNNLAFFRFEGNPIKFILYCFSIDINIYRILILGCVIIGGVLITIYLSNTKFPIVLGDKGPYISLPMPIPSAIQGSNTDALPGVNPGNVELPPMQPEILSDRGGNNSQPIYEPKVEGPKTPDIKPKP